MGKPFSDLDAQVIAILASGGDPLQSQNEAVRKYWEWKLNPSAASHDLPESSTRTQGRKLDDVMITPFSIAMPTGVEAKVTVSKRSLTFYNSKLSDLGVTIDDGTGVSYRLDKFSPAKVYARTGASQSSTERTSRITGRKYKSYYTGTDQGYSAPFGQKTTTDNQFERQLIVKAAVLAIDTTIDLVSFTPEKARP